MIDRTLAKVAAGIALLGAVLVLAIGCASSRAIVPTSSSRPASQPACAEGACTK